MSILSGFLKTKRRRLTDEGYILQSEWTSASTVEFADGMNAEEKMQDIESQILNMSQVELDTTLSVEGQAADAKAVGDTKISYTDVVDNLESTSTDLPLSANMGRELNNKLGEQVTYTLSGTTLRITTK